MGLRTCNGQKRAMKLIILLYDLILNSTVDVDFSAVGARMSFDQAAVSSMYYRDQCIRFG